MVKTTKTNKSGKPGRPLIVGFDMDGTILSNFRSKLKVAKNMGVELSPEQTPAEIIKKFFPPGLYEKFKMAVYDSNEAMKPVLMAGVKGVLSGLKKKGVPFYLVSRRKGPELAIKLLEKHRLWPEYFNKKNSFFVEDPSDKDKIAVKLGITHYIDDERRVLSALVSVPNKYLFDQFDVFDKAGHYIKIKSWSEFEKHLFKNV